MTTKILCPCGAQFSATDLEGAPRTQCPICRLPIEGAPAPAAPAPSAPPLRESQANPTNPISDVSRRAATTPPRERLESQWGGVIPRPYRKQQIGMYFFGGILVAMAPLYLFIGMTMHDEAQSSQSWPNVAGTIISSELREVKNSGRFSRFVDSYMVDVQYTYSVNGQPFTGYRISLGDLPMNHSHARTTAQRYGPGSTHQVYYDPQDPANSVLAPGYGGTNDRAAKIFGIAIPAACGAVGLLLLLGGYCAPYFDWSNSSRFS